MESRFSYTVVGVFVLLLGAATVGVIFWLYAGGPQEQGFRTYYAYFDESVAGLNVNAPVKYKGVTVGRVADIDLAPDGSGRVRLTLAIQEGAPVRADTVATLRMQGLTGLVQVELSGGSASAPPLTARAGEVPVIATRPSLLTRLDTALTTLLAKLDRSVDHFNALTDEESRRRLSRILQHTETLTGELNAQMPLIRTTLGHTAVAAREAGRLARELIETAASVERMAADISRAAVTAAHAAQAMQGDLAQVKNQSLPEFTGLASDLRELAVSLKRVAGELERNPDSLVFGRPLPPPGPGE